MHVTSSVVDIQNLHEICTLTEISIFIWVCVVIFEKERINENMVSLDWRSIEEAYGFCPVVFYIMHHLYRWQCLDSKQIGTNVLMVCCTCYLNFFQTADNRLRGIFIVHKYFCSSKNYKVHVRIIIQCAYSVVSFNVHTYNTHMQSWERMNQCQIHGTGF